MSLTFAQQGTADWTALGRMQFSDSIAVLSRLSSAGIEPLTVAFGQAMTQKLLVLAHFPDNSLGNLYSSGHPRDIAEEIIALGHISRGGTEQVTVQGGPVRCWLATYASLILGLRVDVNSDTNILFRNYDDQSTMLNFE
ncbi:hypothetical protein BDW59DRAFT_160231 [Aspergillus cavernicola]|uniref:Uncharacterized protein n=1 Tax=Aspergillus cavernicola TaxID=176166 RepID=A0ABR4IIJ7_9EURO